MTVWIILAIIAAVIALLLMIPIRIGFHLMYNTDTDGRLNVSYGPITLFSRNIPDDTETDAEAEQKKQEKSEKKKADNKTGETDGKKKPSTTEVIGFLKRNASEIKDMIGAVLKYVLTRSVKIKKLKFRMVIGVEDAMNTAMIYGSACALVYNTTALMDRHMRLEKRSINIRPAFNEPHIFAELDIAARTYIVNIIAIAAIALRHAIPIARRFRKEILKNGKSD